MRMKEISGKTGLTDRAVRLYIDSGLLSPNEESSYTGRRSLNFSDADIEILLAIATLRRADFAIADIRRMQTDPENIGEIIAAHKEKLQSDIETKKRILQNLEYIDVDVPSQREGKLLFTDVAELIEKSASENQIPGEDSSMRDSDFKRMMKRRIPSIAAVLILLIMVILVGQIFIKTAFASYTLLEHGGFETTYDFSGENFSEHILMFVSFLSLIFAFAAALSHVLTGKKTLILLCGVFSLIFIIGVATLPLEIRDNIYRYEFMNFRFSPIGNIYGPNMDGFIRSLKYVGAAITAILCAVGYFVSENE